MKRKPTRASQPLVREPPVEKIRALARCMGLSEPCARELEVAISHLVEDLGASRISREERKEIVRQRRILSRHLRGLERFASNRLASRTAPLHMLLPNASLDAIARLSSDEAMRACAAAGPHPRPMVLPEGPLPPEKREAAGLLHGDLLLLAMVRGAAGPLDEWLAQDRRNKGGSPPDTARRLAIIALANAAPAIIGRRATATANGPFARLCADVLALLGIPGTGLERAIETTLRRWRASRLLQGKGLDDA
ncbi:MAG: hypothetical protein ACKOGH_05315 [Alphaproteobacteria bacterium]